MPSRSSTPLSSQVDALEKNGDEDLLGEIETGERESERERRERRRWKIDIRWRRRTKTSHPEKKTPTPTSKKPSLPKTQTEFIAASPLLPSTGITLPQISSNLQEWISLSKTLAKSLKFDPEDDRSSWSESQRSRVFHYYLPIFFWIRAQLEDKRESSSSGSSSSSCPLVVGIQAPQGCGKTTLVAELEELLAAVGLKAASVSVDDFYLTFGGQQKLADEFKGNPLLELRGNAGSHDLELGSKTLEKLVKGQENGKEILLPRYDKSLHFGRGDRAPESAWPSVSTPIDVVLFEGWMLGFRPVGEEAAAAVSPHLPAVDNFLKEYEGAWDSWCDSWLMIRATNGPSCVYNWRLQAERQLREATGGKGMTDEQVADFVDRFLPAYSAYLPGSAELGPPGSQKGKVLVVGVEDDRSLSRAQPGPPRGLA